MKLKDGRITMLVSADSTKIELHDYESGTTFAKVKLTPEQLSAILSRRAHVECEISVGGLDRLNKKMENKKIEFEIPEGVGYHERREELPILAKAACPDGWEPDNYFGSQDSFFIKDGKKFARVVVRRWVDAH